jgi:hypothetical protein
MSLTSYRAAPPRVGMFWVVIVFVYGRNRLWTYDWLGGGWLFYVPRPDYAFETLSLYRNIIGTRLIGWRTWRRPTLPCLKTQYHGRWGFSRPSSRWDRV